MSDLPPGFAGTGHLIVFQNTPWWSSEKCVTQILVDGWQHGWIRFKNNSVSMADAQWTLIAG